MKPPETADRAGSDTTIAWSRADTSRPHLELRFPESYPDKRYFLSGGSCNAE